MRYIRDDIDRLYVSRRFTSMEDCVDESIQGLREYIKKNKERLILAENCDNLNTDRKTTKTIRQKWEENNCMDFSSDKLARFHTGRRGQDYELID